MSRNTAFQNDIADRIEPIFLTASVEDVAREGLDAASEVLGLPVPEGALELTGESLRIVGMSELRESAGIIWTSFTDKLDPAVHPHGGGDILGRSVRPGAVIAYPEADIDGTASLTLGIVSEIYANESVGPVARVRYDLTGRRLGGRLADGGTCATYTAVIAR